MALEEERSHLKVLAALCVLGGFTPSEPVEGSIVVSNMFKKCMNANDRSSAPSLPANVSIAVRVSDAQPPVKRRHAYPRFTR